MTFTRKLASAGSVLALTAAGLVAAAAPASAAYTPEEFEELDPTELHMLWSWDIEADEPDCLTLGYPGLASGYDFVPVSVQPAHFTIEECQDPDSLVPGVRLSPREGVQAYSAEYSVTYKWVNPSDATEEHYRTRSVFPEAADLAEPTTLTGSWASRLIDLSAFLPELDEGEILMGAYVPEFGGVDDSRLTHQYVGEEWVPVYDITSDPVWRIAHQSGVQVNVRTSADRWLVGKVVLDFPHTAGGPMLVHLNAGETTYEYIEGWTSGWEVEAQGLPDGVTAERVSIDTMRFTAEPGMASTVTEGILRYRDPDDATVSIARTLGLVIVGSDHHTDTDDGGSDTDDGVAETLVLSGKILDSKGNPIDGAVNLEYTVNGEGGYGFGMYAYGGYYFLGIGRSKGDVIRYSLHADAIVNGVKVRGKTVTGTVGTSTNEVTRNLRLTTHHKVTVKGDSKTKAKTRFQVVSKATGKVVAKGFIAKGKRSKTVTVPVGNHRVLVEGAPKAVSMKVTKSRSVKVSTKARAIRTKVTVRVPKSKAKAGVLRVQDRHGYVLKSKTLTSKAIKRAKGKYVKVSVTVRGAGKFTVSAVRGKGSKVYAAKSVKVSAKASTKRVGKKTVTVKSSKSAVKAVPKVRK